MLCRFIPEGSGATTPPCRPCEILLEPMCRVWMAVWIEGRMTWWPELHMMRVLCLGRTHLVWLLMIWWCKGLILLSHELRQGLLLEPRMDWTLSPLRPGFCSAELRFNHRSPLPGTSFPENCRQLLAQ